MWAFVIAAFPVVEEWVKETPSLGRALRLRATAAAAAGAGFDPKSLVA